MTFTIPHARSFTPNTGSCDTHDAYGIVPKEGKKIPDFLYIRPKQKTHQTSIEIYRFAKTQPSLLLSNIKDYNKGIRYETLNLYGSVLAQGVEKNPTIHTLDCSYIKIYPELLTALTPVLKVHTAIQNLFLDTCYLNASATPLLAEIITSTEVLRKLSLNQNGFNPEGLSQLIQALSLNSTITELSLLPASYGTECVTSLTKLVGINSTLTKLTLSLFDEASTAVFCSAVETTTSLTNLTIEAGFGHPAISLQTTSAFAGLIASDNSLTSLKINCHSYIHQFDLSALMSPLITNTSLQHVWISDQEVDPQPYLVEPSLIPLLAQNTTLMSLEIYRGNKKTCSVDTANEIISALHQNGTLTKLVLSYRIERKYPASNLGNDVQYITANNRPLESYIHAILERNRVNQYNRSRTLFEMLLTTHRFIIQYGLYTPFESSTTPVIPRKRHPIYGDYLM